MISRIPIPDLHNEWQALRGNDAILRTAHARVPGETPLRAAAGFLLLELDRDASAQADTERLRREFAGEYDLRELEPTWDRFRDLLRGEARESLAHDVDLLRLGQSSGRDVLNSDEHGLPMKRGPAVRWSFMDKAKRPEGMGAVATVRGGGRYGAFAPRAAQRDANRLCPAAA